MTYKDLRVVKVVDFTVELSNKRVWSVSGFGIMDIQRDELIVLGSALPYILNRKNLAEEVVQMGLLEVPEVYESTIEQRTAIH